MGFKGLRRWGGLFSSSRWLEMEEEGRAGLERCDGFPFGYRGYEISVGCPGWDDLRFIGYLGLELGLGRDRGGR